MHLSEVGAVVHLTDRKSATEPLNGSKDAIGMDLVEDFNVNSPVRYTTYANKPVKRPARYTTYAKKPVKICCIDTKRPVMNSDLSQEQHTKLEVMYLLPNIFCHNFSLLKNDF